MAIPPEEEFGTNRRHALGDPVVIINWVQYLGPPGPFSFPDSRDLLEVLVDFLAVFGRRPTETLAGVENLKTSKSNVTNFMIEWKNET